jgi:signal transduction histidine kinase
MSAALSKEELYHAAIEDEARTGITTLALLATVLFPLFSILDYLTQYADLKVLSIIRFSTTFFFLCTYIFFKKGYGLRRPIHTSNLILGIASLSITLMCMVLQGSEAPYYAGVNLVVLSGVLILPTDAKEMTKTVIIIIGIYVLGIISVEGLTIHSMPTFVNNLSFLIATGVIGVTAAHLKFKFRKEAFIQNLEIKRSVELLQEDLEGHGTNIEGLAQIMVEKKSEAQSAVKIRDSFISMASHELRTPLTSMKLQMDVAMIKLKGGDTDKDQILKHISTAYRQINNILRLVDEMLDVSRIQSGKFVIEKTPLELNDLVSGILLRYYSDQIAAGTMKHYPSPDILKGNWDSFKLEQVIVNLINNAIRYGGEGQVKIETGKKGDEAWIAVCDKGPGISAEEQVKIFEKFERGVSAKSGGLGLGLFISKEIVDAHGGRIELMSEPGKETVFKVHLPLK